MSDALEQKAVEVLNKVGPTLQAFGDKLVDLGKTYGPQVVDATLAVARVDAASNLFLPVLGLLVTTVLLAWPVRQFVKNFPRWKEETPRCNQPSFKIVGTIIGAIVIGILWIIAFINTCNLWAWVGVFSPQVWLAKRVLGL